MIWEAVIETLSAVIDSLGSAVESVLESFSRGKR